MFEKVKLDIIKAGINMDRYGLIALSGGNVSVRMNTGEILMTPSGMIYEEMEVDDVIVMDIDGNIIEGKRSPSTDTDSLLYIFKNMTNVNSIIHTHQPYATSIGLIEDELPCCLTTLANATRGSVKVCPYSEVGTIQIGIDTVDNIGDSLAVILKNHGVVTVGDSLKEALYACVYLEEAAKTYIYARSLSDSVSLLDQKQIDRAVEIFKYYGQGKEK